MERLLDEAIEFYSKNDVVILDEATNKLLVRWFKELKDLRSCVRSSSFQDGYRKGINDFTKTLLSHDVIDKSVIKRIAEQLKG